MATRIPLAYYDNAHRPIASDDLIPPSNIPMSERQGNLLQMLQDGLYYGLTTAWPVIYVNSSGTDDAANGTKADPVATLDYAVARAFAQILVPGTKTIIALQAGQTFTLNNRYVSPDPMSQIVLTYYGDATYGDFDSPYIDGLVPGALVEPLDRPIIELVSLIDEQSLLTCSGFTNCKISLEGVQVNTPEEPAGFPPVEDYGIVDFIDSTPGSSFELNMLGAMFNMTDIDTYFGMVGVRSRTKGVLTQFASQLLIDGVRVSLESESTPNTLAARTRFIHFYNDQAGNDFVRTYMSQTATNSSNASGLLELNWTDANTQVIGGPVLSLGTWPTLTDVNFGLRNYFTNLRRDQQSRPLNVISGRLF